MTLMRRLTAFLLCLLMFLPSQGLTVLAGTVSLESEWTGGELPLEPPEEETERIGGIMPLEPVEDNADHMGEILPQQSLAADHHVIYWNPGGKLPKDLATASNATASDAMFSNGGKDNADGRSPATAVKTFAKAIERAEALMEQGELVSSDLLIYAMNPMEIADGELYVLNGGNIRIASWPGRPYQSDAVFYINGGQLTLVNTLIKSGKADADSAETELIYVHGGILQMGQNVIVDGQIIMDYRSEIESVEWEALATPSDAAVVEAEAAEPDATASEITEFDWMEQSFSAQPVTLSRQKRSLGEATFDINDYILSTEEDIVELVEDNTSASTWQEPVIELIDGFNGAGEYLLKVKDTEDTDTRELVTTLYADNATAEEFLDHFALAEAEAAAWELRVETQTTAENRDTGAAEGVIMNSSVFSEEPLTQKKLLASRAGNGSVIYWNPGPAFISGSDNVPEGNDAVFSGLTPTAPKKSWGEAVNAAKNGIVICMQTLDLGVSNADDYLTMTSPGEFYLASEDVATMTALRSWKTSTGPAILVPAGITLTLKDIAIEGIYDVGEEQMTQTIYIDKGDLVIGENVTAEKGYIQINAFENLASHPIQVTRAKADHEELGLDGILTVFFGGINNNIAYRYTDVVVPAGNLAATIQTDADEEAVGQALMRRVNLHSSNRLSGNVSQFDWVLRPDSGDNSGIEHAKPENLELYAEYYYHAVYLDGVNGKDSNYGATCEYPVKTWARAKAVWEAEMLKSIAARTAAAQDGMSAAEINAKYPVPNVIYICDTVTVATPGEPVWELTDQYDYDGTTKIVTEIVSHIDPSDGVNGSTLRHDEPNPMIRVTGNGVLSINNLFIRNMVDDSDSVTIVVDSNGSLTLKGETVLSGTRLASTNFAAKDLTLGNHVTVKDGGRFVMDTDWTGSIENREQGVVASGLGTTVEMNNGYIQNNNSYRQDLYTAGLTTHKPGTGVVLSDQAVFTMNGGKITGNKAYQYGAGVYLVDDGTSFIMNKGEVSGNNISSTYISQSSSTMLRAFGVGIYAGTGTFVQLGDGGNTGNVREDVLIINNSANVAYGVGVYSDGIVIVDSASISENYAGGGLLSGTTSNAGLGMYLDANSVLTMNDGLIDGNYGIITGIGNAHGAGIYFSANTTNSHSITASTLSNNQSGRESYVSSSIESCSRGGAIYLLSATLTITDSVVSGNRAVVGGGIYAVGTSSAYVNLTLNETIVTENDAQPYNTASYGYGGGIYFYGYGNLTLGDGTEISDNTANMYAGGLYLQGATSASAHYYLMGNTPQAIKITGNEANNTQGGGIYQNGGYLHAENVLVKDNKASSVGGGIYVGTTVSYAYMRNIEITDNRANDGGGLAINYSYYYMQDCIVTGNEATGSGGAFYLSSTSARLYLTETEDGKFRLSGNHAAYGGGISITYASALSMNIAGPIQNSADEQGSNFYLNGYVTNLDLLSGHFMQPIISKQIDGVYNLYIDDISTSATNKYVDMNAVIVEKKIGADPDAVFLNSGSSYLSVLAAPPDGISAAFPIDLNKEVFNSGSVVLKPAVVGSRTYIEPNLQLTGTTSRSKVYSTAFINATTNLAYYTGGKLPRRTQLGGFADATHPTRTNVIVVGQGVYLSGSGDDDNDGTSPADAVKTFDKAKEILEERILETRDTDDDLSDPDEREGFAPFIYICGQVDISGNELWELDYEDSLYRVTNQYYKEAEIRNNDIVYDAQIRRFASFVRAPVASMRAPMIKVEPGSNLTIGTLIIDGMADSVVVSDQSDRSPVIEDSVGAHVILTGNASIRNNYYSALDIYGELTLDDNAELYNNQTMAVVRLYASSQMRMLGHARIWSDDTVEKIPVSSAHGIQVLGADVDISMSGNSGIVQGAGSLLLSSYGIYNNTNSYVNTKIQMSDNAKIEFDNSANGGIYTSGTNSLIEMSDQANITVLEGGSTQYGVYLSGSSIIMSGNANITHGGQRSNVYYGIRLLGSATTTPRVKMQDNAAITLTDTTTGTSTYYGISVASGNSPSVELLNNARISGRSDLTNTHGIYASGSGITDLTIAMNMETTGSPNEAAIISDLMHGVDIRTVTSASLSMGKRAEITNCTYGLYLNTGSNSTSSVDILMKDNSTINNATSGIYFYYANMVPINIKMCDNAAIEKNQFGMSEYLISSTANYSASMLNIEMNGYSRISGNSQYGIRLSNASGGYLPDTHYQTITMNDHAVIGGSTHYDSTNGASGNRYTGIYANGPIQLTMNGSSRISRNGAAINNGTTSGGVYLTRSTGTYYKGGTAKITLNDTASICDNNGGGIYSATITNVLYPNLCEIVLNGIQEDGTLSSPSIQGNTDALFVGSETTLRLKGGALVKTGDSPYSATNYVARTINNYGDIELDGRSTVEGLIYMNDSTRPITMTHAVSDVSQRYDLHLVEGFAGQIVVQPDHVNLTDLTGANTQLPYFNKVSADGMAADRPIVELSPDLVLLGENYVYLSGTGNDANNGNTPSTAVKTFKRAKALLEGEGYYTSGANIIICNSVVNVLAEDAEWSFDAGGYVTNSLSGQTWRPLVIRNEGYSGVLVSLPGGTSTTYASNVTFKNITIDGGSAEGIEVNSTSGSQLLSVGYNRTAVLSEGAVFQNNKNQNTSTPTSGGTLGVYVYGGTLEIDGGTIQNMVWNTTIGSTTLRYSSIAISIQGYSASYPSRVIFKSGRIVNNEFNGPSVRTNLRVGVIGFYTASTSYPMSLEMSGGIIENNQIVTATASTSYTPAYGGAIMNYEGNVTISGGTIRNNQGGYGSAIYHQSSNPSLSRLVLSGGQISGNTTNRPGETSKGVYSPIYISNNGMELNGGGMNIQDSIYLQQIAGVIKISDHINQPNRLYRVYLNQGSGTTQFKKGSVIVEPDADRVTSVASYISFFQVSSNPYVLEVGRTSAAAGSVPGVRENQCLILMKAVYLDSVNGQDTNTGLKPGQAVKTFAKAKSIGELTTHGTSNHYIIYVCGKAISTGADTWSLPAEAYMCRYTGFPVYEADGTETVEVERAYYGPLIEPAFDLTLRDITIYGRRPIDSTANNGDSLISIPSGIKVTVEDGAVLAKNYNVGNYIADDGLSDNLTAMGGAIQVAVGGVLRMEGGSIQETEAAYGNAIYLHASQSDPNQFGRCYLTGSPNISGTVYLGGVDNVTAAYVEPDSSYAPAAQLHISVHNDYDGRTVVSYTNMTPGGDEMDYFTYDDAVQALYGIIISGSTLKLSLRQVIYLDGIDGSDTNDGSTPEQAFKTLKGVFTAISTNQTSDGVLVYIVNTVTVSAGTGEPDDIKLTNIRFINNDGTSYYEGSYSDAVDTIEINGQVFFKRYSQPTAHADYSGYNKGTLYNTLFYVENGGSLTLNGIYIDGHSIDSSSMDERLVAPSVVAQSPLITVKGTGTLNAFLLGTAGNGVETATRLVNNINANQKSDVVGELNDSDIIEGSGAGIELLDGGTCVLEFTEFVNLQLGDDVISGGTDIYNNGNLSFSKRTFFSGTVFLEGFGTEEENQETSRYFTVDYYGLELVNDFQVLMRDPYNGRTVVCYPQVVTPGDNDAAYYRLEERVKDFFRLSNRSGAENILELQVPTAIYIDGTYGVDEQEDRVAGSTPVSPVKSLRRAFELLRTRGGNTIYVVGAIQVTDNIRVTGMSYTGSEGILSLGSTNKINIVRYMQPDFVRNADLSGPMVDGYLDYIVPDYTGVLLNVQDGASAQFSANVYFDGHSEPKNSINLPIGAIVDRNGEAKAPLITVEEGGTLNLLSGVTLYNNNNTYDEEDDSVGMHGGAIYNSGTTAIDGVLFRNNKAAKGAVAYQDGTFTIVSAPENLAGHQNSFYLTTVNTGTETAPVWGTDHVIQTAVAIPENQVFDVDMDHPVKGRDVVRFTNNSAYTPNADAEHVHFRLGSSVPQTLFLVEAEADPDVLELQNWEVLKVEVPTDIYLVVTRRGSYDSTNKLQAVISDPSAGTDLFTTPEYRINNMGIYDAKISITGFEDKTLEAGITSDSDDLMDLTANAATATSEHDLYLAVKGLDDAAQGNGFGFTETSLQPYAEATVTEAPLVLGTLSTQTSGNFTFVGAVGSGFVDEYMDLDFPIEGASKEEVQQYMDGTAVSGQVNAGAKYLMKYKIEIDPSRRTH